MLRLPEAWVWDFWLADDGQNYHIFFLHASRALKHPNDRHLRAAVGHAVSQDLRTWTRVADALVHGDSDEFDRSATWTGSVIRHPDGTWFMFYTGADDTPAGNIQRIGYATSTDLMRWTKNLNNPVLCTDAGWYERLGDSTWRDEAFRDPWLLVDPGGAGWHMLITARANSGAPDQRGVIGHAHSPDLRHWTLGPPLTAPEQGFGQLEVAQVEQVDGRWVLIFSCLSDDLALSRRDGPATGIWATTAEGPLGPFDIANAQPLTDSTLYSGRLIRTRDSGEWFMLAFRHDHPTTGHFVGEITDPMPTHWVNGHLAVVRPGAT